MGNLAPRLDLLRMRLEAEGRIEDADLVQEAMDFMDNILARWRVARAEADAKWEWRT